MVPMHQLYIFLIIAGPIFFFAGFQVGRWSCNRVADRRCKRIS